MNSKLNSFTRPDSRLRTCLEPGDTTSRCLACVDLLDGRPA